MSEAAKNPKSVWPMGWLIRLIGHATLFASIYFAAKDKSASPPFTIDFWYFFRALVIIAIIDFLARWVPENWKPKAGRPYFSPYIIMATFWLFIMCLLLRLGPGLELMKPSHNIHFWVCFTTLVSVSIIYFLRRRVSENWKTKAVREYFSPYVIGATIWLFLLVVFFILDRVLN